MKVKVQSLDAGKGGDIELNDEIFAVEPRPDILHRVVTWQLEKRRGTARAARERSDVARTGKKFGRQKGGGTARHGDRRAPIFIGGGKAHGPRVRDFNPSLNKKMAGHMGARNRTQQNLEIVRTDPIRGLLFVKGSVPGHKGSWLAVTDAVKLPRFEAAPYPAGILEALKEEEVHVPEAGLVDEAAVHEIPALPSDEEVAAIAAEQEAGAAAEAEAEIKAAEDAVQEAQSDEAKPETDESKES